MDVWAWVIAYIVGFALLQLLVLRYLRDDRAAADRGGSGSEHQTVARVESAPATADTSAGRRCEHCGADNESEYRYCGNCAAPL